MVDRKEQQESRFAKWARESRERRASQSTAEQADTRDADTSGAPNDSEEHCDDFEQRHRQRRIAALKKAIEAVPNNSGGAALRQVLSSITRLSRISSGVDVDQVVTQLARVRPSATRDDLIWYASYKSGRKQADIASAMRTEAKIAKDNSKNNSAPSREFRKALTEFNERFAYCRIGADGRISRFPDTPGEPIEFMKLETFRHTYRTHQVNNIAMPEAWFKWKDRRTFDKVVFAPDDANCPASTLNLWRGFAIQPKDGDWTLLRRHLFEVVCRRNPLWFMWLMAWLANLVQSPGKKPGTAIVVKGLKGTGKTKVAEWIAKLAPHNSVVVSKREQIYGRFNSHLAQSIFTAMEEPFWAGDKEGEGILKDLITGATQLIERKGVDAIQVTNHNRLWLCSNSDWVIPASGDERRFLVLHTSEDHRGDIRYFFSIDKQMKMGGLPALMFDLLRIPPDPHVGSLRAPPATPWLTEQVEHSLSATDAWWLDVLTEGAIEDFSWNDEARLVIPVERAWNAFRTSAQARKARAEKVILGRLMKSIGAVRTRPRKPLGENGVHERQWCYDLPPLTALRAAFTSRHGIKFDDPPSAQDFSAWGLIDPEGYRVVYDAWRRYGEGGAGSLVFYRK